MALPKIRISKQTIVTLLSLLLGLLGGQAAPSFLLDAAPHCPPDLVAPPAAPPAITPSSAPAGGAPPTAVPPS